ncbi:HAMP domain-containing protein [Rhodobacteraceae bacterium M382]|nr:HAMP domain-containing protein [Rhodobacteraceae bacterium M382]
MKRLLPRTLSGQLIVMILAALAMAQAISLWMFFDERGLAVRNALGLEAADRAANVARLITEVPADLHPSILRAANSSLARFSLDAVPIVDHLGHGDTQIARRIRAQLFSTEVEIRVESHEEIQPLSPLPGMPPEMVRMHHQMPLEMATVETQIAIGLRQAQWLNVTTRFHRPPLQWAWSQIATFTLTALMVVLVLWLVLRRLTGPLRVLADAADRLGRGEQITPISCTGPDELRRLTGAFNDMQDRLSRFVTERAQVFAALGHDLRSPLTALRVRAEMVEDEETRERLIAIIAEMQEMAEATLSFARGTTTSEPAIETDLAALLAELTEELPDPASATLEASGPAMCRVRSGALRRALRNLIENAVRYGEKARVRLSTGPGMVQIVVEDDGPGIPETDRTRVFDPFVRLETSRSRDTGGTGLGLAIARAIVLAHGGDILLGAASSGGLRVVVTLPCTGVDMKRTPKT